MVNNLDTKGVHPTIKWQGLRLVRDVICIYAKLPIPQTLVNVMRTYATSVCLFCSVSHQMDDNDKHGILAGISLQPSEATSVVSASSGRCADITPYCTNNYKIRENITLEHEPLETMHEVNACSHQIEGVDSHLTTGMQTATYGHLHQKITQKPVILSFENSIQKTTSTQDCSDFIEVKQEINLDCGGYGENTDLTRYWVTCPGGILKEVKAEHKPNVSAILPDEDCGENDDRNESVQNEKQHTKIQEIRTNWKISSTSPCGLPFMRVRRPDSILNNHEQKTHKETKHLSGDPCGPSLTCSSSIDIHTNDIFSTRTQCPRSPKRSDRLDIPGKVHSGMKQFTCNDCGKSFRSTSHLKVHERTHTGVKPFTCATCGNSFARNSNLKVHERIHTGVKPYTCSTCGRSFAHITTLKVHERSHTGVKPFTCDVCGKSFVSSSELKMHERIHTGVKPFRCDVCGKSFISSSHLNMHGRTHTGVKPFTCATCGKSFTSTSSLKVHERTHTGAKPCACDTCGKSFTSTSSLKVHKRTHTGAKPCACDTCGKSFVTSSHLKMHERIHSGVKPCTCDTCGKSFVTSTHLKRHERIHTDLKHFTCDMCWKSFVSSSELKIHKRKHTLV